MLELAVLGLLHESPLHGYELRQRLKAMLGTFRAFSYGSLYPTLRRMQDAGWIVEDEGDAEVVAEAPPLTGRRGKVVYKLTADGKERLAELLAEAGPSAWEDETFGVHFAFFGQTDPEVRVRILEGRRTRLEERREGVRSLARPHPHPARPLHPPAAGARAGVGRARGPLAHRAHRDRALHAGSGTGAVPHHHPTQGKRSALMGSVRVAIVGVGNCAASLVQGVEYYRDADPSARVPGLMHVALGGYHIRDIEFVAAFDVDAKKVGFDLSEAILASENNTIKIADVPPMDVTVQRGNTLDGLGKYYRETIEESDAEPVDVVQALKDAKADVLVCYLPVGSEAAAKFYAQCAIDAKVAFVNALPVFIAGTPEWAEKFRAAGVPIVGDDIKSQVGATITHRVMAKLFEDRGVILDRTYQLNVGGNMDFKNMLERDRLESKKISKTQAVTSNMEHDMGARNVHIGPSDYVQWLDDRKWAYVRLEGRAFGDVPLNLEYKLEVWDSPNSAGVIIDALRCAKVALDRGEGGPVHPASTYFMKSPPRQVRDELGREILEAWLSGEELGKHAAEAIEQASKGS